MYNCHEHKQNEGASIQRMIKISLIFLAIYAIALQLLWAVFTRNFIGSLHIQIFVKHNGKNTILTKHHISLALLARLIVQERRHNTNRFIRKKMNWEHLADTGLLKLINLQSSFQTPRISMLLTTVGRAFRSCGPAPEMLAPPKKLSSWERRSGRPQQPKPVTSGRVGKCVMMSRMSIGHWQPPMHALADRVWNDALPDRQPV